MYIKISSGEKLVYFGPVISDSWGLGVITVYFKIKPDIELGEPFIREYDPVLGDEGLHSLDIDFDSPSKTKITLASIEHRGTVFNLDYLMPPEVTLHFSDQPIIMGEEVRELTILVIRYSVPGIKFT